MTTVAEVLNKLAQARDRQQFSYIWNGYNMFLRRQQLRQNHYDPTVLKALMDIKAIAKISSRRHLTLSKLVAKNRMNRIVREKKANERR